MTQTPSAQQAPDAHEADGQGEKPDLGRTPDALNTTLSGSDMGSDTRAGSVAGGVAGGSERDPDQDAVNESLASEGMTAADGGRDADLEGPAGDPAEGKPDLDEDQDGAGAAKG